MRWHHHVGLAFGIFAFTWVGSGALSLDPFSGGGSPSGAVARLLAGGELYLDRFAVSPSDALAACRCEIQPCELELIQIGACPYYLCRQSPAETRVVAPETRSPRSRRRARSRPSWCWAPAVRSGRRRGCATWCR